MRCHILFTLLLVPTGLACDVVTTVTGRVVDPLGQPILEADIKLIYEPGKPLYRRITTTKTKQDGRFEVSIVHGPSKKIHIRLEVNKNGFVEQAEDLASMEVHQKEIVLEPQDDKAPPKRPLALELQATKKSFALGSVPAFLLTIRNCGKVAEKVLKLRGDLQDTYFDLEVSQNGKRVSVPRSISDPGPITDDDFATLKPGEKVTHKLTRFAAALDRLPAGEYTAVVRFWRPGDSSEKAYASSEAKFKIEK
jgi:hypothetical protein